jgi:hypothetical protein
MKRLLLALAAGTAIMAAAPAVAQYTYGTSDYAPNSANITHRIAQLDARLQAGISAGTIDSTEARSLRRQIRHLSRLERAYSRDGLTPAERQELRQQIRYTRDQMRLADGGSGRYANWNDDDYYGRDGYTSGAGSQFRSPPQVSHVCAQRSGMGGLFGSIFGNDNCLRVGERAAYGLSTVPSQYRAEFPDGPGYYHRYLDGYLVQIDSRSGVVTRIYDVR